MDPLRAALADTLSRAAETNPELGRPAPQLVEAVELPEAGLDVEAVEFDVPVESRDGTRLVARMHAMRLGSKIGWDRWRVELADLVEDAGDTHAEVRATVSDALERMSRRRSDSAPPTLPVPRPPAPVDEDALLEERIAWLCGRHHHLRDEARAVAAPSIRLRLEEDLGGRSYLGGAPFLPAGVEWPRTPSGNPMTFVGQIDLAEVPRTSATESVRASGVLLVFIDRPWPADGDHVAVIGCTEDAQPRVPEALPPELVEDVPWRGVELVADVTFDLEAIDLSEDEADEIYERVDGDGPLHRLFGVPEPLQHDPLEECPERPGRWRLLLQLDSGPPIGDWLDVGRVFLFVPAEDLAAARWDRVWPVVESH